MADARATVLPWPLEPDRVARAAFSHSFRGFDPTEVRSFLARVAGELAALRAREAELTARVSELEHRRPVTPANLDDHQITELLGAEAARVLDAAREAATAIRTNADRHASELLDEARAEAESERAGAATFVEDRRAEAEAEATRVLEAAELEADRLTREAQAALEEAHRQVVERLDAAREDGRRMVAEARAVRERILTDMARRRNHARQQLERLRAGRERLLDAIEAVRAAAEQVAGGLSGSLVEARLAGERAGRQVDVDALPPLNELDAEVELAKDAGLIDLDAIERELVAAGGADAEVELAGSQAELAPADSTLEAAEPVRDDGADPEAEVEVIEAADLVWAEDPSAEAEAGVGEGEVAAGPAEPADGADAAGSPTATVNGDAPTAREPVAVNGHARASASEPEASGDDRTQAEPTEVDEAEVAGATGSATGDADGPTPIDRSAEAEGPEAAAAVDDEPEPAAGSEAAGPADDGAASPIGRGRARRRPTAAGPTVTAPPASSDGDERRPSATSPRTRSARPTSRRKRSAPARPVEFSDAVDDVFTRMKTGPAVDEVAPEAPTAGSAAEGHIADADRGTGGDPEPSNAAAAAPGGAAPGGAVSGDWTALHTRDAVLAGISRDLVRQLKLALSDEQNVVLDRARGAGSGRIRHLDLPDAETTAARYRGTVRRELAAAFAAGWQAALAPPEPGGGPGGPIEQAPVDDADLDAVVDELITALTVPVRERLAVLADADGEQAEDQVRNLYRETRNHRVASVAEHATLSAHAVGQLAALRRRPPGGPESGGSDGPARVRWVFEACSPDCLDNSLAGPVPVGQPFPTGHLHPPAFPGCRCLLVGTDAHPDPERGPEPTPRGRVSSTAV